MSGNDDTPGAKKTKNSVLQKTTKKFEGYAFRICCFNLKPRLDYQFTQNFAIFRHVFWTKLLQFKNSCKLLIFRGHLTVQCLKSLTLVFKIK